MTYNGTERRIKALNLIKRAFESRPKFQPVKIELPSAPPSRLDGERMTYIGAGVETLSALTNHEKDSLFRVPVFIFCSANEDLEAVKIKVSGEAEEVLMGLQLDAEFTDAGMTMIDVDTIDRTPLALAQYGIEGVVQTPIGVVRLDTIVQFSYTAF